MRKTLPALGKYDETDIRKYYMLMSILTSHLLEAGILILHDILFHIHNGHHLMLVLSYDHRKSAL